VQGRREEEKKRSGRRQTRKGDTMQESPQHGTRERKNKTQRVCAIIVRYQTLGRGSTSVPKREKGGNGGEMQNPVTTHTDGSNKPEGAWRWAEVGGENNFRKGIVRGGTQRQTGTGGWVGGLLSGKKGTGEMGEQPKKKGLVCTDRKSPETVKQRKSVLGEQRRPNQINRRRKQGVRGKKKSQTTGELVNPKTTQKNNQIRMPAIKEEKSGNQKKVIGYQRNCQKQNLPTEKGKQPEKTGTLRFDENHL